MQVIIKGPVAALIALAGGEVQGIATEALARYFVVEKLHGGESYLPSVTTPESLAFEISSVQLGLDLVAGVGTGVLAGSIKYSGKLPTVSGTKVTGINYVDGPTKVKLPSTVDLQPTLDRIAKGVRDPHKRDGTEFINRDNVLPALGENYYTEYVIRTPGISNAGPQRLVIGKNGEMYYSQDHYKTFINVKK